MADLAQRGEWIEKWDRPEVLVSDEEVDAWLPLIEGEKAARRCALTLLVLTAGRDSEIMDLRSPSAAKLRASYNRLWTGWKALDSKRSDRWALSEVPMDVISDHYRLARSFDMARFVTVEIEAIRANAVVGVRRALRTVGTRSSRAERKEVNEIIAIIGKELEYLEWAL